MLPALVGAIIGTVYTDINLINLLTFSLTLYFSFCTGISFSYYISSFYRISLTRTITSAIIFIISYSLIFYNYEITGSLEWYLNGQIGRQANYKIGSLNLTPSFTPGYYNEGSGKDLGHALEFKSEIQFSLELPKESQLGFSYNHLSNASLGDKNPGANSYMFNFFKNF